ncbi:MULTISPECIES: tyrosine-type recombinase/integrase [Nocardiopsis]|uniref:tyrosine-type recombinase/integrase n=1 Tax=Nocardiopsis TaxID=2013 RepID=UPI001D049A13|nr:MULTISPECIES: tyrosine-type recombinase/integrase [Nocardiopsis]
MRLLADTGVRLQELTNLTTDDVDLDKRRARVTGKGGRTRWVRFTKRTAMVLDRYLRTRGRHEDAGLGRLWLSAKGGALTKSGVYQMLRRRATRAGVAHVHPHRFRHDFSHRYLDNGGAEGDLMELNGWDSRQMMRHYGRSAAASRAQRHYDQVMDRSA